MSLELVPLEKSWYGCALRAFIRIIETLFSPPQRATWNVPAEQVNIAERGAAAGPSTSQNSLPSKPSSGSLPTTPGESSSGITHEVALKVIAKKKVKGNEESVWGEMEVLKGLDHPNIVCRLLSFFGAEFF